MCNPPPQKVDEGRVAWKDPVKKHLPWFELDDKYAEKYTTVHDLLAMNTVFGEGDAELASVFGAISSERENVEKLKTFVTHRSLRQGYEYANTNFVIAGQIIESITNKSWGDYLRDTIWTPLGMHATFPRARDASPANDLSYGHYVCGGKVVGPFSPSESMYTCVPKFSIASGSVVSSIKVPHCCYRLRNCACRTCPNLRRFSWQKVSRSLNPPAPSRI